MPQAPYDPFKTSAQEVRDRVRTIALAPVVAAATAADREAARARLEPLVTDRLKSGGFAVIPSEEMEKLWRRAADDVGGVYDPVTGEVDNSRFETVEAAVYRDLAAGHDADAVLYLAIVPTPLHLPSTYVTYCGTTTSEPVYWPAPTAHWREDPTLAVVLCLAVVLYDLEGRELYGIRYGLEIVETYAEQTRAIRPISERLRNPGRLSEAVQATVVPLANAGKLAAD